MIKLGVNNIRSISCGVSQKSLIRLIYIFFGLCLLGWFLYLLDASQLPDFEAYNVMYLGGDDLGGRYGAFHKINLISIALGFDYLEFRYLVLAMGLVFAFIVLKIMWENYFLACHPEKFTFKNIIFLLIIVSTFIFEYFVIRLRAGMSIFFFAYFFYIWLYLKKYKINNFLLYFQLFISLQASAFIHFDTFISIAFFVGPALLWGRYINLRGPLVEFLYFTLCLGCWLALFWLGMTHSLEARGPDLASKLNPIRFLMISIMPIMMWTFFKGFYSGPQNKQIRKKYYPYLYAVNYIASAVALLFYYYFSPAADDAGEAIVRVMELSSFGAIMSLAIGGFSFQNGVAIYILAINSLFFLNTVYG